jgi:hypothetical protein
MGEEGMNSQTYFHHAFFQITLPLMATYILTIWLAYRSANKRIDKISRTLDEIDRRLDRIGKS